MSLILARRIGNPLVIVDEVEKAGNVTSDRGQAYDLSGAMLPLLEPMTARRWPCPYFRVPFDMSHVGWVLTANALRGLPEPLLDRCRMIQLGPIPIAELLAFARRQALRRGLPVDSAEAIAQALERGAARRGELSLRMAMRLIEQAEMLEGLPTLH